MPVRFTSILVDESCLYDDNLFELGEDMDDEYRIDPPTPLDPVEPKPNPIDTAKVVERYRQMVYAICLTHTHCRGDADDVFQEVFLTYHRRQPVCNDEEHRKAWLITTTMNIAKRVASTSWRTRVVTVHPAEMEAPPVEVFHFDDPIHDALLRAVAELPDTYRSVVHLFYFEDLPVNKIAAVLDVEPGAVKMRLSRGRAMLREAMNKENDDD